MPQHLLADLGALLPPIVVAVAFCLVTFSLLRREMGPKRRERPRGDNDEE